MTHRIYVEGNALYAFRLAEGGIALIDAGPDLDGTWSDLAAQLRAHDVRAADVRLVIVTHAHADHAGLAAHWATEGARVVCGEADLAALRAGAEAYAATRHAREGELRRHGCPDAVIEAIARRPRPPHRWDGSADVEPVVDGTTFELDGGGALRVLLAPGHTPGNLVVALETITGLGLCSGDTLLPETVPTPGLHFPLGAEGVRWPSLPPFLRSVRNLEALDVGAVLPGHGEVLEGVGDARRLTQRFVRHHERRAARVRAALGHGPLSAFEVATALFPRLPVERLGQALTEVLGHFDLVLEEGAGSLEGGPGGTLVMRLVG